VDRGIFLNISFIIMRPLHNQSYCNISMKNGSNVIITVWKGIKCNYKNWMHFLYFYKRVKAWTEEYFCMKRCASVEKYLSNNPEKMQSLSWSFQKCNQHYKGDNSMKIIILQWTSVFCDAYLKYHENHKD
jgi:hypothetical protein